MGPEDTDDRAHRAYWGRTMRAALRFMRAVRAHPVEECGERLVSLPEAVPRMRDAGVIFSTTLLAGTHERLFYLREGLIADFLAVAREMNARGWVLRVEDGYRTREMQRALGRGEAFDAVLRKVLWERGGDPPTPEGMRERLSALIATCPKIGTHMSGSAVDISVLRREDGAKVDRGAPYLEMSERTPMRSPFVAETARKKRREITAIFRRQGFAAYPYEFWHYSKGDAFEARIRRSSAPARYGAVEWDPATGETTAMEAPQEPLHSDEEIRRRIERALVLLRERPQG
ncbi:MAG: M15 family metallopeptidase [Planctomycetota bacterium]